MPATIEYRGLPALEYAAQTGAQLLRRRREGEPALPIDAAVAHALWQLGAAHQVVCIVVDHRALAAADHPGLAYTLRRSPRLFARVVRIAVRRLGYFKDQLAFFVRMTRLRALASHVET
jgi:hypothetical protein